MRITWMLGLICVCDIRTCMAMVDWECRGKLDSPVDAAAVAWALGYIGYRADASTLQVC
jgi:hypothetical protein